MKKLYSTIIISLAASLFFFQDLYSQDGQLDPGFGQAGIVTSSYEVSGNCVLNSTALQKDGKIIAGGYSQKGNQYAFTVARYNTDGVLDNSFGTKGVVVTAVGTKNDQAQTVTIQDDGKIILAGFSTSGTNNNFALVRYNQNGSLDPNFGTGGIVTSSVGANTSSIYSIKVQSDGKIVAAGFASTGNRFEYAVVRYNANGTPDNTFGTNGIVMTPVSVSSDNISSLAIQSNGKIIAAGSSSDGNKYVTSLVRYNINGDLDNTFGTNGIVLTPKGTYSDGVYSVIIQTDGKIIAAGYSYDGNITEIMLVRYNSNGTLDSGFGTNGIALTQVGNVSIAYSIALQSDGKLIVTGRAYNGTSDDFLTLRYNTNGTIDSQFGTNGIKINSFGSTDDDSNSVLIQNDRMIITAGSSGSSFKRFFILVRYNTTGVLDNTFANSGIATTHLGESFYASLSSIMQNDGKIIAAGYYKNPSVANDYDFSVYRFNEDGSQDNTFGSNGFTETRLENSDEIGRSIALQSDGKIIVAGSATFSAYTKFALARYNPNGVLDLNFGTSGIASFFVGNSNDAARSVAIQSDGMIVAAGYTLNVNNNKDIAVIRYDPSLGLDVAFGTNGIVKTPVGNGDDVANAIAIQNDGKIIVAGSTYNGSSFDIALARYNKNGTPDGTFGTNGIVIYHSVYSKEANTLALQSDGKIVVAGYGFNGSDNDFTLVRFSSAGVLDNTFGTNGAVLTPVGSGNDQVYSITIQSDGKILAGGESARGSLSDFAIARYNKNGTPDITFGTNGLVVTPIGNSISSVNSIFEKNEKVLVSGSSSDGGSYSVLTLARYTISQITGITEPKTVENTNSIMLQQNYPNPFKTNTKIVYDIPASGLVTLKIYKFTGQEIITLVNLEQTPGQYEVDFDAAGLDSGVYYYVLKVGDKSKTRTMIVSK
jgi:uncharacterized delta-60 repeat protein